MYQYKAVLTTTNETIAEGHTIQEIEAALVHFKREQKHGLHTHGHDKVAIYHIQRDHVHGTHKDVLIKTETK